MSLYTPVFPPLHPLNNSQKVSPENDSLVSLGKQQSYVKYLRDVHLFLSSQNDVLSPPSRPNSPLASKRVQKVEDKIQDIFNTTDETMSGKWTRASQVLKLGCVRGRHWSVSPAGPYAPEQSMDWILPDEESEWIEWEKKREEKRKLKGKTNASQQMAVVLATPESQQPSHASLAGPSQRSSTQRLHPDVSPRTLRAARDKVTKWQASVASEMGHDASRGRSPASGREVEVVAEGKRGTARPQRRRTLDFAVMKPAAKPFAGKKKGFGSHPVTRDNSTPVPLRRSKTPTKPVNILPEVAPAHVDELASQGPAKTPPTKGDAAKIANVSETPYLPPSFPADLETSTPLPSSKIVVRTKPPPILPVALSTPPPSTPANPPDDLQVAHVAHESLSLPPQDGNLQQGKRTRAFSAPVDGIPNGPPVTPPAKRLRTFSQNRVCSPSIPAKLISPNGVLNDTRGISGAEPSSGHPLDLALGVSLAPGKDDQPTTSTGVQDSVKIPSPTKSVKSYFSTPDSDLADSPLKANLLLESPVSPMLSYAQNPSIFLPQVTSTQRKGSPTPGKASTGVFGIGYSSQFDVERHVDRVSELLEKDVDFDGWLHDARTVEQTSEE